MTSDSPEIELDVETVVEAIIKLQPESVAVCLRHAYRYLQHEQALGEALAAHDVHVSLSHQVVGTFREYERAATTIPTPPSPLRAALDSMTLSPCLRIMPRSALLARRLQQVGQVSPRPPCSQPYTS